MVSIWRMAVRPKVDWKAAGRRLGAEDAENGVDLLLDEGHAAHVGREDAGHGAGLHGHAVVGGGLHPAVAVVDVVLGEVRIGDEVRRGVGLAALVPGAAHVLGDEVLLHVRRLELLVEDGHGQVAVEHLLRVVVAVGPVGAFEDAPGDVAAAALGRR